MTQIQGERTENSFAGQIQLNGDAAPELEVILALTDQHVVLNHASGELGRWSKTAVRVAPVGRGWFSLDVEDENVAFRPRRPGAFAASTLDLAPVEDTKKRRGRRNAAKGKKAEPAQPKLSRKEKRRLRREESAAQAESRESSPPAGRRGGLAPLPEVPPVDDPAPGPDPVRRESGPEPPPSVPPAVPEPPAEPIQPAAAEANPADETLPELFTRRPTLPEPQLPASPWDDVPTPQVPGTERGRSKPAKPAGGRKTEAPRAKTVEPRQEKTKKPRREKAVKLSGAKPPKKRREPKAAAVAPIATEPVGPPKKSAVNRAFTAFKYGARGVMYRISDELRQSGIVPFDRLPAAPARIQSDEDHEHDFREHRLPGGLTRNVCHDCGLVSIGEADGLDR